MRSAAFAALALLLVLAPTAMAAWGMPDPINPRMETIHSLFSQILLVGSLVFLFVFGWLIYSLVKFRPGGEGEATDEEHRGSVKAELVWTIIPLLIVAWVGVISFQGISELPRADEDATTTIHVTGFQWFWEFEYENGATLSQKPAANGSLATQPAFYIPADQPVTFNITAGDVIHSFYLPELGVKTDAIPGTNNFATVTVPEGEYLVQCAEMCGLNHAYMNAKIKAVPQDEYETWLSENKPTPRGLQSIELTISDEGIQPDTIRAAGGIETSLVVTNSASGPRELAIDGTGNATGEIEPGQTATLNVTLEPGDYTLTSGDDQASLSVLETEEVTADLEDSMGGEAWAVHLSTTSFETGKAYLFEVNNVGAVPHNLFIGTPEESGDTENVLVESDDVSAGDSTTVVWIPGEDETGSFEAWCDVPGHYGSGMHVPVDVQ